MSKTVEIKFNDESKMNRIMIKERAYFIKNTFTIKTYQTAKEIINMENDYKKAFDIIKMDIFKKEIESRNITIEELKNIEEKDDKNIVIMLLKNKRQQEIYEEIQEQNIYIRYFKVLDIDIEQTLKEGIKSIVEKNSNLIGKLIETINDSFATKLSNILKSIYILADNLDKIVGFEEENLKTLATYGWTTWSDAPISLFGNKINSKEEADKICLEYIREETLSQILKQAKDTSKKNDYIEESIKMFEIEHYRPCAMLIIAYIDRVISENIVLNDDTKHTRKIGNRGVKLMKETIEKDRKDDFLIFVILHNLLVFLEILFKDGNDFKEKVEYPNRNYLMHGWLEYKINKVDCIKLYIALLNLNKNIPDIKKIFEKYKEEL